MARAQTTAEPSVRRSGGLAILAAAAAIGLAACGGGHNSSHVANLGTNGGDGGGTTATTLPKGDATQLLDEWATGMRSHGDLDQADQIIDADKVINIAGTNG